MGLPDPPAPAVGMRNALASTPTSTNVSQLAATSYHLSTPDSAFAFPASCLPVKAHAAGSQDLFATILDQFLIFTDASAKITVSCPTRLHVEPTDLSVTRLLDGTAMAAVAGFDGVFVSRLASRKATALQLLLGSDSHPCVAVDVSERGAVAVGSMAGQIALWASLDADACVVIGVPDRVDLCDRLTQIRFTRDGDIVVAWWSGLFIRYTFCKNKASCVWKLTSAQWRGREFCTFSGTFFAFATDGNGERAVMTRGDGVIYYVHLATGESSKRVLSLSQRKVVVKGLCTSAQGTFLWLRDFRRLFRIEWPDMKHEAPSSALNGMP